MSTTWSAAELSAVHAATELRIAVRQPDGSLARWLPIWVVRAGAGIYVRSWYRRDTGWIGQAVRSRRARIRVPGLDADTTIEDLGDTSIEVTTAVDEAYRAKYGAGARSMTTSAAVATTLRLDPAPPTSPRACGDGGVPGTPG